MGSRRAQSRVQIRLPLWSAIIRLEILRDNTAVNRLPNSRNNEVFEIQVESGIEKYKW